MTDDPDAHIDVLTPSQCWELLRTQVVGRLGVAIMNRPDIFPVNFIVDHGSIVFRTDEGTKLAAAVLGTAVAFEADHYDPSAGVAWSVVVKGEAHRDPEDVGCVRRCRSAAIPVASRAEASIRTGEPR